MDINPNLVTAILLTNGDWSSVVEGSFNPGDPLPPPWSQDVIGATWVETGKANSKGRGQPSQRTVFALLSDIKALAYQWDDTRPE